MSMLLRLALIQATIWPNFEAVVHQRSFGIFTRKKFFATETHRLQYDMVGNVDTNNPHPSLTYKTMNLPTLRYLISKISDNASKLTFQTLRMGSIRNPENCHSNRNVTNNIASSNKGRILRRQNRISDTLIRHLTGPKHVNYSTNASKNSKTIFSSTGADNDMRSGATVIGYNQTGAKKLDTSNPVNHPSLKLSDKIQKVKTTSQNKNGYFLNQCSCERTKCDCSGLLIEFVPQNLPTTITELLLNANEIVQLSRNVFSRYAILETLVLSHNMMSVLEEGAFAKLSVLTYLDLSSNNLIQNDPQIAVNIFEPLKSLKILRMDLNIVHLSNTYALDTVLSYLKNVEDLDVDNYIETWEGEIFGPGFENMTSLRNLTINCRLSDIRCLSNSTFLYLRNITSLDIKNCGIEGKHIEAGAFSHFRKLEILDISENTKIGMEYLSLITCGLNSSNFQTLKMDFIVNDRSITMINNSVTECMPQTMTKLSARGNNIMFIDRKAVFKLPTSLRTIDIRDNNIFTDPEDIPLQHFVQLETLLISSNRGECASSDDDTSLKTTFSKWKFQKSKNFMLKYKTTKFKAERKLKSLLPTTLKRVKIAVENINDKYLLNIDERNNLQEIDVSCSYLTKFYLGSFRHLPNLKRVIARRSSMYDITPELFYNISSIDTLILEGNYLHNFINSFKWLFFYLVNLLHLDISVNQLKNLPRHLLHGLDKLEYLHLGNNSFSVFSADISNITQLKLLNLSNTELSQLPGHVRSHIDQLCKVKPGQVRVDMSGCPIQCDCFNLDFLKWMVSCPAFEKNFTGYICKYPDTSSKAIEDGYLETVHVLDRECAKNYPKFLVVLAATSILMCIVVVSIIYRFRWKIRYLYYAAYLKIMDKHKNDNQQEFVYDVFISYDYEDHRFVTELMAPELENRGLKLLIHSRDFVAGTYIASNIVMAVSESRKTLVVLTRNLLESNWCNYELQMATMEAVHTGRPVLVFLLKENIPNNELDLDLLRHIRSNTYMPYPDPEEEDDADVMKRFYDKLVHDLQQ